MNIVSFERVLDKDVLELGAKAGIKIYSYDEILEVGKVNSLQVQESTTNDVFMLSYTSGTTGDPKGVKLSHGMIVNSVTAGSMRSIKSPFCESDSYISYLPAAHSFEQALFSTSIIFGMKCGFFGGNLLEMISHDLPCLKPTFFPSVPRLFNKIYSKI